MQRTFAGTGTLLRWQLLHAVPDPHSPSGSSGLAQFMRLDSRICRFLLGDDQCDARLAGVAHLHRSPGGSHVVDDAVAAMVGEQLRAPHQRVGGPFCICRARLRPTLRPWRDGYVASTGSRSSSSTWQSC